MHAKIWFSLALLLAGCSRDRGKDYQLAEESFDAKSMSMVEELTGINLPKGSRGQRLFYQGSSIDPAFWAKIKVSASAHDSFVKQLERIPNTSGGIMNEHVKDAPWWNPLRVNVEIERYFHKDMNGVHILLCKENEEFILYVVWVKV